MAPTVKKKRNGKPSSTSTFSSGPGHKTISKPNPPLNAKSKSRSEIDDIFSARGSISIPSESISANPKSSPSLALLPEKKKKKRKRQEREEDGAEEEWLGFGDHDITGAVNQHRDDAIPKVEIILDPSLPYSFPTSSGIKEPKRDHGLLAPSFFTANMKAGKVVNSEDENAGRFKDSRGTGPRRKTEEGYVIYKEDELNIHDNAGNTPQCPFDCDCCF